MDRKNNINGEEKNMAKEIKQRIVLEGEKQYSAAIKEAQRNIKTFTPESFMPFDRLPGPGNVTL